MDLNVSIIIPVFNRVSLVGETLESILSQTYTAWECIIVDDGSTDGTIEMLEAYQTKDERIKVFERPSHLPKGAPSCRNYGFDQAIGDFIQYFDSDDLMLPEMLLEKVKYLKEHDDACFVVSKMGEFDENGIRKIDDYLLTSSNLKLDFLQYKVYFLTPGPLFRKPFLEQFKVRFDLLLIRSQESEFFSRIILADPVFGTIDKIHCLRRIHSDSIKINHRKLSAVSNVRARFNYYYRLHVNSEKVYSDILYQAYGYRIFRIIFSFLLRGDIHYGFKAILLYLSLLSGSLFSRAKAFKFLNN